MISAESQPIPAPQTPSDVPPSSPTQQTLLVNPGPEAVLSGEYRFSARLDSSVLPKQETEIWARAFWPKNLRGVRVRPIVFLLHGNHPTCGTLSKPRTDIDCQYTTTGQCPSDMMVVPNHQGHAYIAEHLASHGFIAVSINANRGITCGYGSESDFGLVQARGRLVLKHIELWNAWSKRGGAPQSLGLQENAFVGVIDFAQVGLFGHSRGAEGVRAAYNFAKMPNAPILTKIPELKIRGIFEVAGTDGLSTKVFDALDVAWNQIIPLCDGDVSDLAGRRPYERMLPKADEATPTPKSLYMVWGANHNFFNSEWQNNESFGCENHQAIFQPTDHESPNQRQIALLAASDFFRAHVGAAREPVLSRHFNPRFPLPDALTTITNVDRDMTISPSSLYTIRFEDFDQPTGVNSHGELNSANGIEFEQMNDSATGFIADPSRAKTPGQAKIRWDRPGSDVFFQTNWAAVGTAKSIEGLATLDIRVARARDLNRNMDIQTDFSIHLVHADESLSDPVRALQFGHVRGPVHPITTFETVRIPLTAFANARLSEVRGIRFVFDRTPRGSLRLANIRLAALSNAEGPIMGSMSQMARAQSKLDKDAADTKHVSWKNRFSRLFKADRTVRVVRAFVIKARLKEGSPQLSERNVVELSVISPARFPVIEDLPYLKIDGQRFMAIRFENGSTRRLIITIPYRQWVQFRAGSVMTLEYGPRLRFRLPPFDPEWLK